MSVSGPGTAQLRELIEKMRELGSAKHMKKISTAIGAEARALVQRGFDTSSAPDETPWKAIRPRSKKETHPKPLRDTGRLMRSFGYRMSPTEVVVTSNVEYAAIQNYGGTVHIPARSQTNVHGRGGKFVSRSKAERRSGSSRVSFSKLSAHTVTIPARPMVPGQDLSPLWAVRFETVSRLAVTEVLEQP